MFILIAMFTGNQRLCDAAPKASVRQTHINVGHFGAASAASE